MLSLASGLAQWQNAPARMRRACRSCLAHRPDQTCEPARLAGKTKINARADKEAAETGVAGDDTRGGISISFPASAEHSGTGVTLIETLQQQLARLLK